MYKVYNIKMMEKIIVPEKGTGDVIVKEKEDRNGIKMNEYFDSGVVLIDECSLSCLIDIDRVLCDKSLW